MHIGRGHQRAALQDWVQALPNERVDEAWNVAFGPRSLFDAWTRTSIVQALHQRNAATLRRHLAGRDGWRVLEIGAGDGRLWQGIPVEGGEILVVDPAAEAGERVRAAAAGATVVPIVATVESTLQDADLWRDLDLVVCSLTLHHVAGADAAERRAHGLTGPGKLEVLQRIRDALTNDGLLLLNEADVHCDLELPPGPLLADRLMDSYVRRCAGSLLIDIEERSDADEDLRERWRSVVRHWCLEQVRYADVPIAERDVYELDVGRWLRLLDRAGLRVVERGFTDDILLFHRYVLMAAGG